MKYIIVVIIFISAYTKTSAGDYWFYPDEKYRPVAHIGSSSVIVVLTYLSLDKFTRIKTPQAKLVLACLTSFSMGMAKEIFDANTGGYPDVYDLQNNIYGVDIGITITLPIIYFQKKHAVF